MNRIFGIDRLFQNLIFLEILADLPIIPNKRAPPPPALLVNCFQIWSKAPALLAIPNLERGRVIQGITVRLI